MGGTTRKVWDSDLAKSIEPVACSLHRKPNPEIEAPADAVIALRGRLQAEDGCLAFFFLRTKPEWRWTDLRDFHELCRMSDLLARRFGRGPGQVQSYDGHEEVELAPVKLARVTGNQAQMDLARFLVDKRGREPKFFVEEALAHGRDPKGWQRNIGECNQSHLPVREQTKVVGPAVRAMCLYSGMADVATEYHDDGGALPSVGRPPARRDARLRARGAGLTVMAHPSDVARCGRQALRRPRGGPWPL